MSTWRKEKNQLKCYSMSGNNVAEKIITTNYHLITLYVHIFPFYYLHVKPFHCTYQLTITPYTNVHIKYSSVQ